VPDSPEQHCKAPEWLAPLLQVFPMKPNLLYQVQRYAAVLYVDKCSKLLFATIRLGPGAS
jgi:hypothetical protein